MKYLVTGSPGWLGTRFLRALTGNIDDLSGITPIKSNDEIICLVLPNMQSDFLEGIDDRIKTVEGNITDKSSLSKFFADSQGSILFHLAGIIHPGFWVRQIYNINFEGTRNLLEHAIDSGVQRIISTSSNSPIGTNPRHDHLFDESSPYNPYMAYGKSKMQMEVLLNNAFSEKKIESVILRPCWFYGPDQPPRQTTFFSMVKNGKAPIIGGGESRRSMSYVDNTCQALLLCALSKKANGNTYWIADSNPYSMNEIIDTIERLLELEFNIEVKHKRLRLPNLASGFAYYMDSLTQAFGFYLQKVHVLSEMNKTIACSIEKAKEDLNYRPKINLEEGMRRSIKWCLDNGHKI